VKFGPIMSDEIRFKTVTEVKRFCQNFKKRSNSFKYFAPLFTAAELHNTVAVGPKSCAKPYLCFFMGGNSRHTRCVCAGVFVCVSVCVCVCVSVSVSVCLYAVFLLHVGEIHL
jgi:hypothetical protein